MADADPDVLPGHVAAADADPDVLPGHVDTPASLPASVVATLKTAAGMPLDVPHTGLPLKETAEGLHAAADIQQEGAGAAGAGVAESVARAGYPKLATAAGVAAGAVPAAVSTLTQGAAGMIPTKVGDVAAILATEGLGAGFGAAFPTAKALLTERPVTQVAGQALAAAQKLGIPLGLDEVANTKAFSDLGAMLRKYPMTTGIMDAFDQARNQALMDARQRVLDQFVPAKGRPDLGAQASQDAAAALADTDAARASAYAAKRAALPVVTSPAAGVTTTSRVPSGALPETTAAKLAEAATGMKAGAKSLDRSLYGYADALFPDTDAIQVDRAPVQAAAQAIIDAKGGKPLVNSPAYTIAQRLVGENLDPEEEALLQSKLKPEALKFLRGQGLNPEQAAKFVPANPPNASFLPPELQGPLANSNKMSLTQLNSQIDELSTELSKSRATSGGDFTPEARALLQMKSALEKTRSDFFAAQGGEAAQRYAVADAFHGDYVDTFRNQKIKGLFGADPSGTVDTILSGGNQADMARLLKAVGPTGQPLVKSALMDKVFGPATVNATDPITGQAVAKVNIPMMADVADRLSQYGPALRAVLTPPEMTQWTQFAKTGAEPLFLRSEFENRMRALLASKNDAQISNAMLGGDTLTAQAGKKFLDPATFDGYRAQLANELLSGNGAANLAKYSDEFLNTYFTPAQLDGMRTVGAAQKLLPGFTDLAKAPAAKASAAIQFAPTLSALGAAAGAVGGELSGKGITGTAIGATVGGVFTIGSRQLAKLYTTEGGQRILTTLMRMNEADPRLPQVLTRLAQMGYLQHSAAAQAKLPQPGTP